MLAILRRRLIILFFGTLGLSGFGRKPLYCGCVSVMMNLIRRLRMSLFQHTGCGLGAG
jgi:hypothetical protein